MSSPFSSLKKGKSPFLPGHIPGHRPIPFRHPEYSEDESRLLEEITTSMAASRMKAVDPFKGGLPTNFMDTSPNPSLVGINQGINNSSDPEPGSSTPTDRELMKLMMARLTVMEQKVHSQEREIKEKDRYIKVLEDKLHILSKARSDLNPENDDKENINNSQRVQELEQHCLLLQQQVHEMETFLADYGMVWVGEQDDENVEVYIPCEDCTIQGKEREHGTQTLLDTSEENTFKIDFNLIMQNIHDLNLIAGEGEARVYHTADGARLKRPEPVPLAFYANGMIMFDGPFRPYTDPATVQCLQDILDGFFPSELQSRYPDGVPFSVRDMRFVFFQPKRATDVFSGVGQILGGEEQQLSRLVPSDSQNVSQYCHDETQSKNSSVTSKLPGREMTVAQFLSKLPKSVVKGGKVIDIRNSVGNTLTGESSSFPSAERPQITVVETSVTKSIQRTLAESKRERPKTPRDVTTLRIKSESGNNTYIVKMRFNETVGDLRKYLNQHRDGESSEYEISSTYPRKQLVDDNASMQECGLVPNGVLYLRAVKKGWHHSICIFTKSRALLITIPFSEDCF